MIPASFLRIIISMLAPDLGKDITDQILSLARSVNDPKVFYSELNKLIADSPIRGDS